MDKITARRTRNGGFSQREQTKFNPVATAWASLALITDSQNNEIVQIAQMKLASTQRPDGRLVSADGAAN